MKKIIYIILVISMASCGVASDQLKAEVYETSANGNALKKVTDFHTDKNIVVINLNSNQSFQTITGFGGAFTESSASLLYKLSPAKRKEVLNAYFGKDGAAYSLTRTHINSCDFSLKQYAYAMVDGDKNLEHFLLKKIKRTT